MDGFIKGVVADYNSSKAGSKKLISKFRGTIHSIKKDENIFQFDSGKSRYHLFPNQGK